MKTKIALLMALLAGIFFLPTPARADDDDDGFFERILEASVTLDTGYGDITVTYDYDRGCYGYYGGYPDYRRRSRRGRSPYTGAPEPVYRGRR